MIHQKIKEALGDDGYINFIKHFAARKQRVYFWPGNLPGRKGIKALQASL
jgi:hypothetical protein